MWSFAVSESPDNVAVSRRGQDQALHYTRARALRHGGGTRDGEAGYPVPGVHSNISRQGRGKGDLGYSAKTNAYLR